MGGSGGTGGSGGNAGGSGGMGGSGGSVDDGAFADAKIDLASNLRGPRALTSDGNAVYWINMQQGAGPQPEVIQRYNHANGQVEGVGGLIDNMSPIVFDADHFYVSGRISGQGGVFQFSKSTNLGAYAPIAQAMSIDANHPPAVDGSHAYWTQGDGMGGLDVYGSPTASPAPAKLYNLATPNATWLEADDDSLYFIYMGTLSKAPKTAGAVTPTTVVPADQFQSSIDQFHLLGDSVYFARQFGFWRMKKDGSGQPELLYQADNMGNCFSSNPGFAVFGSHLYWSTSCTENGQTHGEIRRVSTTPGGMMEVVVPDLTTEPTSLTVDAHGLYWSFDATLPNGLPGGGIERLAFR
jgi:hypothetical protein